MYVSDHWNAWLAGVITCVYWLPDKVTSINQQLVCTTESFSAVCPPDHVVVIRSALYGRMEYSRCVDKNYGYLGCGADVTAHLHALCSGRRKCEVRVPLSTLEETTPCPNDLKSYLEAEYECVQVGPPASASCPPSDMFLVNATSRGILASVVTMDTNIGGPGCAYVLQADKFQSIKLSLRDFQMPPSRSTSLTTKCTNAYATVKEPDDDHPVIICGAGQEEETVYTSRGNVVQVRILGGRNGQGARFFFLKYEALGCSIPDLGPYVTFIRRKDQPSSATVTCLQTDQSWTVSCQDDAWENLQEVNCNGMPFVPGGREVMEPSGNKNITHKMSLLIIIAIAAAIGLIILLIGMLIIWWRRRVTDPYSHPGPSCALENEKLRDRYLGPLPPPLDPSGSEQGYFLRENDYAYISDMSSTYDPSSIGPPLGQPQRNDVIYQCQRHPNKDFFGCTYTQHPAPHRCAKIKANLKHLNADGKPEVDRRLPVPATSPILPLVSNNNELPSSGRGNMESGVHNGPRLNDTVRKGKHNERIYGPVQYTTYDHLMNAEGRSNHKSV